MNPKFFSLGPNDNRNVFSLFVTQQLIGNMVPHCSLEIILDQPIPEESVSRTRVSTGSVLR